MAAFLRAAPASASLKLARAFGFELGPSAAPGLAAIVRGSRAARRVQFGWSRADFKPLKPRFFRLCGAPLPQAGVAAVAAELPQFPWVQRQELQALGWSQSLTPTLDTCQVTLPCVRVYCRALKGLNGGTRPSWLQHKACGFSSSLEGRGHLS